MKTTTDKKASKGIKIRSAVKGGEHVLLARQTVNHNASKGIVVKTKVKAGGITWNHNPSRATRG